MGLKFGSAAPSRHDPPGDLARWRLHLGAMICLALPLLALALFWQTPFSGVAIDIESGRVLQVDAGSMAEQAGVRAGDRVERWYDYRWEDAPYQLLLDPLEWQNLREVPISVVRDGELLQLTMAVAPPSLAFQIEKLAAMLIAAIFWFCGYLLGLVRRHEQHGSGVVAWFWMVLGAIIGCYTFALYESYPLTLVLQWLLLTFITPLSVYLHVWFPARPVSQEAARRARRWLRVALVGAQLSFVALAAGTWPSLLRLIDLLNMIIPIALIATLLINTAQLVQVHRRVRSAHIRRQVRLIALACLIVASVWIALRSIPVVLWGSAAIPSYVLDLVSVLVPLAYLAGGTLPDLYRTDHGARWIAAQLCTALALLTLLALALSQLGLSTAAAAAWLTLGAIALHRPTYVAGRWLLRRRRAQPPDQPLITTAAQLTWSLDADEQARLLCDGVQAALSQAPVAVYLEDRSGTGALAQIAARGWDLPAQLAEGPLTAHLRTLTAITESRAITAALGDAADEQGQELLQHQAVALWCPLVKRTQGTLLGVLLIGLRGDLDPYRPNDMLEIQRLVDTAALAFSNSAAYHQVVESEATTRLLYTKLQRVRDDLAMLLVREIHDEVLNMPVRLNIELLQQLQRLPEARPLRMQIEELLDGEHTTTELLRALCELLHPTGVDDPRGLPGLLHRHISRIRRGWNGTVSLKIHGAVLDLTTVIQREALRIVREAVINAIKHARGATTITVDVHYPPAHGAPLRITIADNGGGRLPIQLPSDHWGVRSMVEGARRVDGTLAFEQRQPGIAIHFTCPASPRDDAGEQALLEGIVPLVGAN